MESGNAFVAGGGWCKRTIVARPKTRQIGFCAVVWALVAFLGASLFEGNLTELDAFLVVFGGLAIGIEIILLILTALLFWTEAPMAVEILEQNADRHPYNLY
ncbi:hypothetical protein GC207_06450 [bacterium]|nr:hypothetical protein [bacterium]